MRHGDRGRWSAYLDGELSAAEAAELEVGLSTSERGRLAGEVRFENALGECLRTGDCPPPLWSAVRSRLQTSAPRPGRPFWRRTVPGWAAALAVCLVVAGVYGVYAVVGRPHAVTFLAANDAEAVDVGAPETEAFLVDHGLRVALQPVRTLEGHARHAELIGAREMDYDGERVVCVVYVCCGKPVNLIVAPLGGAADRALQDAFVNGCVQATRHVGNTVAAVVGRHRLPELVNLLQEPPQRA